MTPIEQLVITAIESVCNKGPFIVDQRKSTVHCLVYHCQACGAELRFGTTVTIPTWAHYRPGCEPSWRKRG